MDQKVSTALAALVSIATFNLFAAAPSNPNACAEAKALYRYLQDISGKQILSGQESMFSDGAPSTRDKFIFGKVGKYPALYTSDFGDVNTNNLSDRRKVVSNCGKYSDSGAVIALQYHMIQPDQPDGAGYNVMKTGGGYGKIPEILTEGNQWNTTFKQRLDEIAGYFNAMEKSGIAVLWRPFHEMNCNCFWWSYQSRFKDLWIYTWKYLTETKKCNNLLWVFGANWYSQNSGSQEKPATYYPGHEYVDILTVDVYTGYGHSYGQHLHDDLLALGGGKPIAIAENGTMPDIPAIKASQPKWAFWCTWWGFEGSKIDPGTRKEIGNPDDNQYVRIYSDPSVITRDELPHDKLHPPVAVLPVHTGQARPAEAMLVTAKKTGMRIVSLASCERITVFGIDGRFIAEIDGQDITVPFDRLGAGTCVIQATGPDGHSLRRTVVLR